MKSELLINKQWDIEGNWYSPVNYLRESPEVVRAELINTMSSAGDWEGYILQSHGGKFYLIPFSQENNWPRSYGFSVYTGESLAEFDHKPSADECDEVIAFYYVEGY